MRPHTMGAIRPGRTWPTGCGGGAWLGGLVVALGIAAPAVSAQVEPIARDGWQRVDAIVAALHAEPGDRIADVGAGNGFLTLRLSPVVGASGRVLAVDVDRRALERLWDEALAAGFANIDTLVSVPDDPRLPPGSVDGAVIVNAYHEMESFPAMLHGIRRALRPGGRLVIVDNVPSDSAASRQAQTARHDIAMGLVERDLLAHGFRVIERMPDFIPGAGRRRPQWLLAAVAAP